jgi:hypothetical protein
LGDLVSTGGNIESVPDELAVLFRGLLHVANMNENAITMQLMNFNIQENF